MGIPLPDHLRAPQVFEIFEENLPVLEMFCRMTTQWRVGMNGRLGFDYNVLPWLFSLYPTADPCAVFEGLQIMEVTILEEQG